MRTGNGEKHLLELRFSDGLKALVLKVTLKILLDVKTLHDPSRRFENLSRLEKAGPCLSYLPIQEHLAWRYHM